MIIYDLFVLFGKKDKLCYIEISYMFIIGYFFLVVKRFFGKIL